MTLKNKIKIILIAVLSILAITLVIALQLGYIYITPSKQKMYAEMDSLISIIEKTNPHLKIYEEIMNYNVIEEIKKQREKIKDVKNIDDYYKIIHTSLRLIPEIHCRLIKSQELKKDSYWVENYPKIFDKSTL